MKEQPPKISADLFEFWGGYTIEFKLVEKDRFDELKDDLQTLRRSAIGVGKRGSPRFTIDISRHEYCEGKHQVLFDDYSKFVYSPEMFVAEKLRAICQQMPEYGPVVRRTRSTTGLARDFVDIQAFVERFPIEFANEGFHQVIQKVFEIKRVPLGFLAKISDHREFHRASFESVHDTFRPDQHLNEFDAYFDFVLDICQQLKPLWDE